MKGLGGRGSSNIRCCAAAAEDNTPRRAAPMLLLLLSPSVFLLLSLLLPTSLSPFSFFPHYLSFPLRLSVSPSSALAALLCDFVSI